MASGADEQVLSWDRGVPSAVRVAGVSDKVVLGFQIPAWRRVHSRGGGGSSLLPRGGAMQRPLSGACGQHISAGYVGTYLAVDARGSIERQHSRVACMILSLAGAILCPPACRETSRGWVVRGERELRLFLVARVR